MDAIASQRVKVDNLQRKLNRMGAMVPPPIRAEVARKHQQEVDKLNRMLEAS